MTFLKLKSHILSLDPWKNSPKGTHGHSCYKQILGQDSCKNKIDSLMFLYVDYYAMQWSNLSLTMHVMLGIQA